MDALAPVAVVTDTAAALPSRLLEEYGIEVVRFWVQMGEESFVSGEGIDPEGFFARLRRNPDLQVSTSVPAVSKFVEVYERVAQRAKAIVSVHVAGKQSATVATATLAAHESPVPVVVIDSETTAMGEGFVALQAARAALAGGSLEEVVVEAQSVVNNVGLIALLESVSYALKGGRLKSAAGRVGSLLNIQPLIRVQRNHVGVTGQARRRSKGLESLMDKIAYEAREDPTHLTVHYAEDEAEGQRLLEALKARVNLVESHLTRVPVELGVHAGPGSIGVAFYVERESLGLAEQLERIREQAKQAILSRLPGRDRES